MDEITFQRCHHVVSENERTVEAVNTLGPVTSSALAS